MDNIYLRASSLPDLLDCPARWEAKTLKRLFMPTSGNAWMGTSLHRALSEHDNAVLEGSSMTSDDVATSFVGALFYPDEEVNWDDLDPKKLEPIGIKLIENYLSQIPETHKFVAVEVTCDDMEVVFEDPGITITLTGTADRIRQDPDGQFGVSDLKSGKQAVGVDGIAKTKGHGYQLGVYELLAEHASGLQITAPAEVIGLQTNGKARVGTDQIFSPRDALIGEPGLPGILEYAANLLKKGLFFGNPKSMLCGKKYCPIFDMCRFRGDN